MVNRALYYTKKSSINPLINRIIAKSPPKKHSNWSNNRKHATPFSTFDVTTFGRPSRFKISIFTTFHPFAESVRLTFEHTHTHDRRSTTRKRRQREDLPFRPTKSKKSHPTSLIVGFSRRLRFAEARNQIQVNLYTWNAYAERSQFNY